MTDPALVSKILVPVEFSERCRGAVRYAEALACRFHAGIVLLHVVPPPYAVYGGAGEAAAYSNIDDILAERVSAAQNQLHLFRRELTPDLPVRTELREGDPARVIVEYAHADNFNLIVMPTHGYGPFRRFLIGSVTAKVLHDVDTPVWTGPHLEQAPESKSFDLQRVVCAIDLGEHSAAVLRWASSMASSSGADLTVVHALPASAEGVGGMSFDPDWRADRAHDARGRIEQLQKELGVPAARIDIEVGEPAAALTRVAADAGAGLMVIGRSVAGGVLGRLRANAYAIIRESPCPVVSV
jgi:nucleotide-binding universal stress UspA family protein